MQPGPSHRKSGTGWGPSAHSDTHSCTHSPTCTVKQKMLTYSHMHVQTFTHACTHLHALQQSQRLLKIHFSPLTPHIGCQDNFKDTPLQLLFISLIPSPPFIPSFPQSQISLIPRSPLSLASLSSPDLPHPQISSSPDPQIYLPSHPQISLHPLFPPHLQISLILSSNPPSPPHSSSSFLISSFPIPSSSFQLLPSPSSFHFGMFLFIWLVFRHRCLTM